jgi:hypothetical protein
LNSGKKIKYSPEDYFTQQRKLKPKIHKEYEALEDVRILNGCVG